MTGSGQWWKPWGAVRIDGLPEIGAVVAFEHAVWTVLAVSVLLDDDGDLPAAPTHTLALRCLGNRESERHVPTHRYDWWWTYPEGRYPLCSCCGEPSPCRAQLACTAAEIEVARMRRYDLPGVCPACGACVRPEDEQVTFELNLEVPLGQPVTFHLSDPACACEADRYAQRCAEDTRLRGR
jgi:heme/copper-type cytochrome/quinol oxidase subunit 2